MSLIAKTDAHRPHIAWLLGSGASYPAGMPGLAELTELLLKPGRMYRDMSTATYFPVDLNRSVSRSEMDPPEQVLKFIGLIESQVKGYFDRKQRHSTYEDLYSLSAQIHDSEVEYDNPALQLLIEIIERQAQPLWGDKKCNIQALAEEACGYIHDTIEHSLRMAPKRLDYFRCVTDSLSDRADSSLDVFTLNHDLVFERWCQKEGLSLVDGFGTPSEDGVRYWEPETYDRDPRRLRLFKLHGSIDWRRVSLNKSWGDRIGIEARPKAFSSLRTHSNIDPRSPLLIGTFTKMLDYSQSIHADLRCQFQHRLRDADILVVCGYGFNDKGINSRIIDWMYRPDKRNRLVVIDPNFQDLQTCARPAISNKWGSWKKEGRLFPIPRKIENVSWIQIRDNLGLISRL